jgi:hypothetical protein
VAILHEEEHGSGLAPLLAFRTSLAWSRWKPCARVMAARTSGWRPQPPDSRPQPRPRGPRGSYFTTPTVYLSQFGSMQDVSLGDLYINGTNPVYINCSIDNGGKLAIVEWEE